MRFRTLDSSGNWTYGAGQNNFAQAQGAAELAIQTRLLSFLGDCFFDAGAGLNWFAFLSTPGPENELALNLAVSAVILNTPDENGNQIVLGLQQLSIILNPETRSLAIQYQAITVFSTITGAFTYDLSGQS